METGYIEILDPTGSTAQREVLPSKRLRGLDSKTIGLLDNGKPNFDIFLDRVEELLCQGRRLAGIIKVRKNDSDTSAPLNPKDLERLVKECDIVLNGICD